VSPKKVYNIAVILVFEQFKKDFQRSFGRFYETGVNFFGTPGTQLIANIYPNNYYSLKQGWWCLKIVI